MDMNPAPLLESGDVAFAQLFESLMNLFNLSHFSLPKGRLRFLGSVKVLLSTSVLLLSSRTGMQYKENPAALFYVISFLPTGSGEWREIDRQLTEERNLSNGGFPGPLTTQYQ